MQDSTNYNSNKNQSIKGKFVNREVIENINLAVEDLIKAHQLDSDLGFDIYEHLQWYYTASDGEQYTQEEAEEKADELENEIFKIDDILERYVDIQDDENINSLTERSILNKLNKLEELKEQKEAFKDELENADFEEITEIYEYWSVSSWLADKLKEKGQIIINECGFCIWGRQTTGQAILLDYVISQICEDLEILEGQKNEWKA